MPAPELHLESANGTRRAIGIISLGGCHAAVLEAGGPAAQPTGTTVDYMRIRAFPFAGEACARSSRRTSACFVVEQNRDGQLRTLLAIETGWRETA